MHSAVATTFVEIKHLRIFATALCLPAALAEVGGVVSRASICGGTQARTVDWRGIYGGSIVVWQ